MKLVYAWIGEYLNIKNQGINFGSQWIYSHHFEEEAKTLHFDRQRNTNFLPNLFSLGDAQLDNVTAIVGENGAGKTNILEFLGYAIKEDSGFYGRLIFEKDIDNICITPGNISEVSEIFFRERGIELDTLLITATFNFIDLGKNNRPEVVYYSPIYDFRRSTSEENKWINVSSNYLIRNDGTDRRAEQDENFSSVEYHKASEIQRQLSFLANKERLGLETNLSGLSYPEQISVNFVSFQIPYSDNLSEPYNFSVSFRSFLKDAFTYDRRNIWGREVDIIKNQEYEEKEKIRNSGHGFRDNSRINNIIRWKALVFALKNVFAAIIRNADTDPGNTLLESHFTDAIEAVHGDDFNLDLDFATLEFDSESNFESFLVKFLSNQDTLYFESILPLFKEIKVAIFSNEVGDWDVHTGKCRIVMPVPNVYPLLEAYRTMLKRHTYITNVPMLWGFIDFEWDGMSSGEISFLSLFSRMYLAEDLILSRTENTQYEKDQKPYPSSVIIFIDEGEQGFHLQWQKRYISLLVESLPKFFKIGTKVQLIFASHSPIPLSDIPRSNIVLLKKHLKTREIEIMDASLLSVNTFAGNIYDLLKDSFFLSDGFVGNFAEGKINSLIRFLRNDTENEGGEEKSSNAILGDGFNQVHFKFNAKNAKAFIQIVDEPILRRKLWELYTQRFSGPSEEDKIRDEIERLQAQLILINSKK
jgi:AAA15 family ATPase/GTPase